MNRKIQCTCPNCGTNYKKELLFLNLSTLSQFRIIAFLEGISFLLLMLMAVPLKYFWDEPIVVSFIGAIHGALFMAFLYYQYESNLKHKWDMRFNAIAFIASLIPFGTFWLDKELEKKAKEAKEI